MNSPPKGRQTSYIEAGQQRESSSAASVERAGGSMGLEAMARSRAGGATQTWPGKGTRATAAKSSGRLVRQAQFVLVRFRLPRAWHKRAPRNRLGATPLSALDFYRAVSSNEPGRRQPTSLCAARRLGAHYINGHIGGQAQFARHRAHGSLGRFLNLCLVRLFQLTK